MRIRHGVARLVLVCLLVLSGCGERPPAEPDYSQLIVPPLDLTITDCLTAEMVQEVTGESTQLLGVFDDQSQAVYMSDNWRVTVNMQNNTRAGHDAFVQSLDAATPVEGVGELSHWCEGTGSLLTYVEGYTLEIFMSPTDAFVPKEETIRLMQALIKNMPVSAVADAAE